MEKDRPGPDAVLQAPEQETDMDKLKEVSGVEKYEAQKTDTAVLEPSTLPWPENRAQPQLSAEKDVERTSIKSDCMSFKGGVSRTESEREEFMMSEKMSTAEEWSETGKESASKTELRNQCLEIEVEEVNVMPEHAARVFSPNITVLHPNSQHEAKEEWTDREEDRLPFLGSHATHGVPLENYYQHWSDEKPQTCCFGRCSREALKLGTSMFMSALIFPLMVWGGYVFLPFDAPLLDGAPLRMVYTLRCSVFAVVPIVLGMLALGFSRVWYTSLTPRCEGEREVKQVAVHQHYVQDSISLFFLYFLQLSIMAAYLNQHLLKLVPLLTIIFAFGRLLYWIAAMCNSSVRGFGFGFSFLPMLVMLVANLYFIFLSDSAGSLFAQEVTEPPAPQVKQRFWG